MELVNYDEKNLVDKFLDNDPLTKSQLIELNNELLEFLNILNIKINITNEYILANLNQETIKFIDTKLNSDNELNIYLNNLYKTSHYQDIYDYIFYKRLYVHMKEIYTIFFNNYEKSYNKYRQYNNIIVSGGIISKLLTSLNGLSVKDFLDKSFQSDKSLDNKEDNKEDKNNIIDIFIDYYVNNYDNKFIGNILYFTKKDRKLKEKIEEYLSSIKDQLNIKDFYKTFYTQILSYYKDKQKLLETDILKSNNVCQKDDLKNIRENLGNLNSQKLKYYNVNQFFNEKSLNTTMCALNSLFYTNINDDNYHTDIIKRYIHNLKKIGEESKYGYAFTADFIHANDAFVIKTPKDRKNDNLLHELIVGLYGTNKLRKDIPNFAYIYGGFKCSPMLLNNNNVESWCKRINKTNKTNKSNDVNYILYENINPSILFYDYLETCSTDDFLNMFLQILYALNYANKTVDFTHYDTKGDNILIRTIDNIRELQNFGYNNNFDELENPYNFQIKYPDGNGGFVYITTNAIPTFIDYGMSHIKTDDNIDIGLYDYYDRNIYGDKSWIISDVYSILIDVLLTISQINFELKPCIELIFKFFNKVENIDIILEKSKNRTADGNYIFNKLPYTQEAFEQLTIDKLITYIRAVFNCYFVNETSNQLGENPILNCESLKCVSNDELYKDILTENNTELIDLYYNYQTLDNLQKLESLPKFDYEKSNKKHYDNLIVINLNITDIDNYLYENIIKYGFLNLLTLKPDVLYDIFVNLIRLMDDVSLLNNYIEIGKYFALMFDNKDNYKKYEDINITVINNNIKEYIEAYTSVKDEYEILKPLESYIL